MWGTQIWSNCAFCGGCAGHPKRRGRAVAECYIVNSDIEDVFDSDTVKIPAQRRTSSREGKL